MGKVNPLNYEFHIKQDDLYPAIRVKLFNVCDSEYVDLTGWTGKFYMASVMDKSIAKVDAGTVEITDEISGTLAICARLLPVSLCRVFSNLAVSNASINSFFCLGAEISFSYALINLEIGCSFFFIPDPDTDTEFNGSMTVPCEPVVTIPKSSIFGFNLDNGISNRIAVLMRSILE